MKDMDRKRVFRFLRENVKGIELCSDNDIENNIDFENGESFSIYELDNHYEKYQDLEDYVEPDIPFSLYMWKILTKISQRKETNTSTSKINDEEMLKISSYMDDEKREIVHDKMNDETSNFDFLVEYCKLDVDFVDDILYHNFKYIYDIM